MGEREDEERRRGVKEGKGVGGRRRWNVEKLGREGEVGSVEMLSGEKVGGFRRVGAEAKADPRKVVVPVGSGGKCTEGSFEWWWKHSMRLLDWEW